MARLNTKIVIRNDSLTNWGNNADVVLLQGEIAIAFDTNGKIHLKIGDGVKTWAQLDWYKDEIAHELISALRTDLDALSTCVGAPADEENEATGIYGDIAALAASVDEKIDQRIADFKELVSDDGKVNTLIEIADYIAQHNNETEEIKTELKSLQDIVNDNVIKEVYVNGALVEVVNGRLDIEVAAAIKSNDEIIANEDGTLSIGKVDASKLVTSEGSSIILNGGSANV